MRPSSICVSVTCGSTRRGAAPAGARGGWVAGSGWRSGRRRLLVLLVLVVRALDARGAGAVLDLDAARLRLLRHGDRQRQDAVGVGRVEPVGVEVASEQELAAVAPSGPLGDE